MTDLSIPDHPARPKEEGRRIRRLQRMALRHVDHRVSHLARNVTSSRAVRMKRTGTMIDHRKPGKSHRPVRLVRARGHETVASPPANCFAIVAPTRPGNACRLVSTICMRKRYSADSPDDASFDCCCAPAALPYDDRYHAYPPEPPQPFAAKIPSAAPAPSAASTPPASTAAA
jgi:hypothetical protein